MITALTVGRSLIIDAIPAAISVLTGAAAGNAIPIASNLIENLFSSTAETDMKKPTSQTQKTQAGKSPA